jgi:uncharacterized protein (DUF697 family)
MARELPLRPRALRKLVVEQRRVEADTRPLVVAGESDLAARLESELTEDAGPGAVSGEDDLERAIALVYVLSGDPDEKATSFLRLAARRHVPIVCLREGASDSPVPYVLATDIARLHPDRSLPLEEIGRLLARRLDGGAAALAARVPTLRPAISKELIRRAARRSGLIGAAVFIPAPDLPAISMEQARLVLRLALAHGHKLEPIRAVELAAVLAAGLGLRKLARRSRRGLLPAWGVQGSIAYAGTLALGEAAMRYFESAARARVRPSELT